MAILRLGYVQVRVTDLAEAKKHYVETLGLKVTAEEPGKLYLKGWDEWDHHSVVLQEGGVGVEKLGFKTLKNEDLDVIEKNVQTFGASVERMSKGESLEIGDGIRITSPPATPSRSTTRSPSWAARRATSTRTRSRGTRSGSRSQPSTTC